MDPLSQAVVGAVASQNLSHKNEVRWATFFGALSGMAPDLDVLIKSETDPLLYFEYHRHFTHSFAFIPIGAFICALFFKLAFKSCTLSFKRIYLYCCLGFGSHGLLDACTSYGTQLFWPFSNTRIAWDNISIIDPIFTIPLVIFTLLAVIKKKVSWAHVSLIFGLSYLLIGKVQNYRALQWAQTLIEERGHTAIHHSVKPSFANLVLWKSIYEYEGRFYVDAIRVGLYKKSIVEGESIQKFDLKRDMPWLDKDSVQAQDIKRFHWFSDGYVALDESSPYRIADVRYSQLPHQINGMWGIELNPEAAKGAHAQRYSARRSVGGEQVKRNLDVLWSMILGEYKKDE